MKKKTPITYKQAVELNSFGRSINIKVTAKKIAGKIVLCFLNTEIDDLIYATLMLKNHANTLVETQLYLVS